MIENSLNKGPIGKIFFSQTDVAENHYYSLSLIRVKVFQTVSDYFVFTQLIY